MQKKVGIIGAMDVELAALKAGLLPLQGESGIRTTVAGGLEFYEGLLDGTAVVVVKSGVGKVNAALCAQRLAVQFGATHIINTGIAGAMASGLRVLDFVASTDAVYHDMDATGFGYKVCEIPQMKTSSFASDPKLLGAAKEAFASLEQAKEHRLFAGRIATGDQFISDGEAKKRIRENCAPSCVEMEGAAIAHACHLNGIPFIIIRCMSDMADDAGESAYSFNESAAAELSAALVRKMLSRF